MGPAFSKRKSPVEGNLGELVEEVHAILQDKVKLLTEEIADANRERATLRAALDEAQMRLTATADKYKEQNDRYAGGCFTALFPPDPMPNPLYTIFICAPTFVLNLLVAGGAVACIPFKSVEGRTAYRGIWGADETSGLRGTFCRIMVLQILQHRLQLPCEDRRVTGRSFEGTRRVRIY